MIAAKRIVRLATQKQIRLVTAESCTGGLLAAKITAVAGASQIFLGGIVAYDTQAKHHWLGLNPISLERDGAVSEETAIALALAAHAKGQTITSGMVLSLAVTGVAGPAADTLPVGWVYFAYALGHNQPLRSGIELFDLRDAVSRHRIRTRAVDAILARAVALLEDQPAMNHGK